jgi:hypothetical protein
MARDTGYPQVSGGNIAVDFVWGNFPMQPDDDRSGAETNIGGSTGDTGWSATTYVGSEVLTKTAISTSLNNWNKYPDYDPVAPFLDTTDQAAMPNVVGLNETAAGAALVAAGFVKGTVTTTADGATAENDGLVKTQAVAATTVTNLGTSVNLVKYAYVAP